VPDNVMLEMDNAPFPVFAIAICDAALVVPTSSAPNDGPVPGNATLGTRPIPDSVTTWGLDIALFAMSSVAASAPPATG
jgi:hypothetical protein